MEILTTTGKMGKFFFFFFFFTFFLNYLKNCLKKKKKNGGGGGGTKYSKPTPFTGIMFLRIPQVVEL